MENWTEEPSFECMNKIRRWENPQLNIVIQIHEKNRNSNSPVFPFVKRKLKLCCDNSGQSEVNITNKALMFWFKCVMLFKHVLMLWFPDFK